MSFTLYGKRLTNSHFSGAPVVFQPFTLPNITRLKAVRSWFIAYNNPTFTQLEMRIYANNLGMPTDLLHTFDKVWTLSEITSSAYAAKELYFDFTTPIWLRSGTLYHLVPWVTGASFSVGSHLSWVKGFPDPNMGTSLDVGNQNIAQLPAYAAFIGGEP